MLLTINPVPAILTRLVALQDNPASLPPEQTLKEPSTRPLPVRHRSAKLGTAATPPWNPCSAASLMHLHAPWSARRGMERSSALSPPFLSLVSRLMSHRSSYAPLCRRRPLHCAAPLCRTRSSVCEAERTTPDPKPSLIGPWVADLPNSGDSAVERRRAPPLAPPPARPNALDRPI
jgi:hypothetical protein